jgi:fructoselysine transporter
MTEARSTGLARVLSPFEVLLLTLSALSPVLSVFIGGNGVLHLAGTGAALAFLLGGAFNILFCLLYSEVAAAFPGAGGVYPSLTRLLGPRWSYAYVMLGVPLTFFSVAFAGLGLASYVHTLVPVVPLLAIAVAGIVLAGLISIFGIKNNALITGAFLAVELIALAVLTVVAIRHLTNSLSHVLFHPVELARDRLVATPPVTLAIATISGVWATAGASWALYFAEEMQDVQQRIGRVVAWSGAIASLTIALPLILVVLAIDDLPAVLHSEAPIATFLDRSAGPLIGTVITVGVVAAIFNALVASIMGQSRFLFAVGRDRALPGPISRLLAMIHPRFRSPIGASLTVVALASVLTLLGERWLLIIISGNVSDYILVALAVWAGRRSGLTGHYFKVPLHPLVPLLGMFGGAGAIYADWQDVDAGRPSMGLLLMVFSGAWAFYGWRRRKLGHDIVLSGTDTASPDAPG